MIRLVNSRFSNKVGEFGNVSDFHLTEKYSQPGEINNISSLTHRLLVHMWRHAGPTNAQKLENYHRHFNEICALKMRSFQFLDEETLLIHYSNSAVRSDIDLLSVYNLNTTEVEAVFDCDCKDFATFVTDNIFDFFMPTLSFKQARLISRANATLYTAYYKRHFSPGSGMTDRRNWKRFIPFYCQQAHCSPYLNCHDWEWPEDRVTMTNRLLTCSEKCCNQNDEVVFLSRDRQRKFRLHALSGNRDFLIFHPSEPLVISACLNKDTSIPDSNIHYYYHLHFHCPY